MFLKKIIAIAAFGVAAITTPAVAQEKPIELDSDVKLVRIVEENGTTNSTLVAPEGVVPGDTLVFTTSYRNRAGDTITDFVIVNPVPRNMRLSPNSAAEHVVSVDGGSEWGALADLTVTDEEGNVVSAQADDVTHLRWTIAQLAPGQSGSVNFAAIVR